MSWQVSHEFPFNFNKRNLDSLARSGQLPEFKRSLASLAKSGQLPEKLVQEKRMLDVLEQASDANSRAIHEQRSRVVEVFYTGFFTYTNYIANLNIKKKKYVYDNDLC